jgi:hypothetical protein
MQFWKSCFPAVVLIALLIMIVTNLFFQDIYTSKYSSLYNTFHTSKNYPNQGTNQDLFSPNLSNQNVINQEIQQKKKIAYIFAGSARSFVCDKVIWVI